MEASYASARKRQNDYSVPSHRASAPAASRQGERRGEAPELSFFCGRFQVGFRPGGEGQGLPQLDSPLSGRMKETTA